MLLIVGTVRLGSNGLKDARSAMTKMIVASRGEVGCIHYSYAEDVLDARLIHVNELWRDRAALNRHFSSSHIAEWRAAWPSLGIRDRNLALYEVGEGEPT